MSCARGMRYYGILRYYGNKGRITFSTFANDWIVFRDTRA